jgi:hypothetical protein
MTPQITTAGIKQSLKRVTIIVGVFGFTQMRGVDTGLTSLYISFYISLWLDEYVIKKPLKSL